MSEEGMDIDYVANLARIELSNEERSKFQSQLGQVLQYFEKLQKVDVDGVEPTAHAFPRFNVWDEDEASSGFEVEKALAKRSAKKKPSDRCSKSGRRVIY